MTVLIASGQLAAGAEFLGLLVIAGELPGFLGILVGIARRKSRFAFRAGLISCCLGAGLPLLLYLLPDGRDLTYEGYLLLATPLLTGLPAIMLSFRSPLQWLGAANRGE
jgi:hypothetical protein